MNIKDQLESIKKDYREWLAWAKAIGSVNISISDLKKIYWLISTMDALKKDEELLKVLNDNNLTAMTSLHKENTQLKKEIERLQKFIDTLQIVHFTELQTEKAENARLLKRFIRDSREAKE